MKAFYLLFTAEEAAKGKKNVVMALPFELRERQREERHNEGVLFILNSIGRKDAGTVGLRQDR